MNLNLSEMSERELQVLKHQLQIKILELKILELQTEGQFLDESDVLAQASENASEQSVGENACEICRVKPLNLRSENSHNFPFKPEDKIVSLRSDCRVSIPPPLTSTTSDRKFVVTQGAGDGIISSNPTSHGATGQRTQYARSHGILESSLDFSIRVKNSEAKWKNSEFFDEEDVPFYSPVDGLIWDVSIGFKNNGGPGNYGNAITIRMNQKDCKERHIFLTFAHAKFCSIEWFIDNDSIFQNGRSTEKWKSFINMDLSKIKNECFDDIQKRQGEIQYLVRSEKPSISVGQPLGFIGSTGVGTGAHLHMTASIGVYKSENGSNNFYAADSRQNDFWPKWNDIEVEKDQLKTRKPPVFLRGMTKGNGFPEGDNVKSFPMTIKTSK